MGSLFGAANQSHYSNPYDPAYGQEMANQQAQLYGQQQNLAQVLQGQMNGQGPNPAQTQFLGNTQNNIANTQGMIASQRGLNPALAARMGVNAASNANQQAALGSALMQQQQQLAATSNLGNLYGQIQQGNLGYQNQYTGGQQNANAMNQQVAEGNTNRNAQLVGGVLAAGGAAGAAALGKPKAAAHGGYVTGGEVKAPGDSPKNDTVHALLSPGEIVIPRTMAHDPEKAKEFVDHLLKSKGDSGNDYGEVLKARRKKSAK